LISLLPFFQGQNKDNIPTLFINDLKKEIDKTTYNKIYKIGL